MDAIVYVSNTGSAKGYAEMLSKSIEIPALELKIAAKNLKKGANIIFVGWVSASTVKGYKKAAKLFNISAVCAVGISKTGTATDIVRNKTKIGSNIPLFTLQGNFDAERLKGIYRFVMKTMIGNLSAKENKTDEEKEMLEAMQNGKHNVKFEALSGFFNWYMESKK